MSYSSNDGDDGEGSAATQGSGYNKTRKSIRDQLETTLINAIDDDKIEDERAGEGMTNNSQSGATKDNTQQKYLGPCLQDEASGLGEKMK